MAVRRSGLGPPRTSPLCSAGVGAGRPALTARRGRQLGELAIAFSDVVIDGVVVERSRVESQAAAGSLQSICWGSQARRPRRLAPPPRALRPRTATRRPVQEHGDTAPGRRRRSGGCPAR